MAGRRRKHSEDFKRDAVALRCYDKCQALIVDNLKAQ